MRQSQLGIKTRKETPVDEVSKNASLLIRAGYVHKTMAGVYSFLPLGLKAFHNIVSVIREEMNAIGGQEVSMSSLQSPSLWEASGRWSGDTDEVWFRSNLRVGGPVGFGWTHEEPMTELMRHHIYSYRDLPVYLYQFQTKFRNETRAKSGIMRTREFVMKDLYSFCSDREQHELFYEQCAKAYIKIFDRVGLGTVTYRTFASGGAFSKFSEEFQTVLESGEDTIYVHKEKKQAINKEVLSDTTLSDLGWSREDLEEKPSSEVGNIFTLGSRFSEALDLNYTTEQGDRVPAFMGCYGIGPARLLGVIAEHYSSERALLLPESVAPFKAHLLVISEKQAIRDAAETLYTELASRGVTVLFDDRSVSAGEKFADHDLLGIPHRLVLSEKTHEVGKVEHLDRLHDRERMPSLDADAVLQSLYA